MGIVITQRFRQFIGWLILCCCSALTLAAQQPGKPLPGAARPPVSGGVGESPSSGASATPEKGMMMLTIFLGHDQSKTLDEINAHLKQTGFTSNFPPPGTEVVSWYVMMGIGQVVTLRFPAEKLREVNLAIEHGAWGAFHTEFYPTYDYQHIWEAERQAAKGGSH